MKTVTLLDVARAAGVSKATVSNVFSAPLRVRPQLRERVHMAARDLGYSGPDPKGRLLSSGKVNAIGVLPFGAFGVGTFFKSVYQQAFIAGVAEACEEKGVGLSLVSGRSDQGAWGIRTALVDGFIFTGIEQTKFLDNNRRRLPFVVMDFDGAPDINSVSVANRDGAMRITRHLLELGHRRFVIVSGLFALRPPVFHAATGWPRQLTAAHPSTLEKLDGIADALAEAGLSLNDAPICESCCSAKEEAAFGSGAAMVFDRAPEATAAIVLQDNVALGLMREAARRGVSIPDDLSIVGSDDIPEAALASPPLTTLSISPAEIGKAAARLLLEGGPPRQIVVPTTLVIRQSTAPPRKT